MSATTYSDRERAIFGLYNQTLARIQFALKMACGVCDRDRNIAGLMLAFASWETFRDSGAVTCWVGVETLAECDREDALKARRDGKRVDRSRVQRAQRALMKVGVIRRRSAGGGRGRSAVYEFALDWLERFVADAESWAPAAARAKLRPTQGATVYGSLHGGTGATVSGGLPADNQAYGGTTATVSPRSATVSSQYGGSTATVSGQSATVSLADGGSSAAVVGQSATVWPRDGGMGATVSPQSATVSGHGATGGAAISPDSEAESFGAVRNGSTTAAISQLESPHFEENGGTSAVEKVASVQPENKDLKINIPRRPFQPPLLLPVTGGKSVDAAIKDAQARSRAVAAVESDGRFDMLRKKAVQLLDGDIQSANLAIAHMDERIKKDCLKGRWPLPSELMHALREGLRTVQSHLPALGAPDPAGPMLPGPVVPPFSAGEALPEIREDRVERLALQASQQAVEVAESVRTLRGELAEIKGLLMRLAGGSGQQSAVA